MRKIENNCVGCQLPCINCGRRRQEVVVCDGDKCSNYADYTISGLDNGDYCKECLESIIDSIFLDMPLDEKLDLLQDVITVVQKY
jgi:hypothetical protein